MVKAVSIATFNLLNLAAVGQVIRPGTDPIDQETFDRKIAWIAEGIQRIDADLIGFQEVWSRDALIACFDKAGLTNKYTIIARDGPVGLVQVAAAVRRGLKVLTSERDAWIDNFPPEAKFIKRPPRPGQPLNTMRVDIDQFSRPVLSLGVKMDSAVTLRFFVMHLKSKLAMDLDAPEAADPAIKPHRQAIGEALSAIRRVAEAAALRVWLNKELADTRTPAVVVGDLNDGHLSTTAGILAAQPPYKLFAASRVGQQPAKSGDIGLYSAQLLQQYRSIRDVYYTYDHENILESLDHIFVSEEFYEHSPRRLWTFRDMKVFNDHIYRTAKNQKIVSDHGFLVARFDAARPA